MLMMATISDPWHFWDVNAGNELLGELEVVNQFLAVLHTRCSFSIDGRIYRHMACVPRYENVILDEESLQAGKIYCNFYAISDPEYRRVVDGEPLQWHRAPGMLGSLGSSSL